jgi:4-hydroxybenzoate polyprenyltransferase
MLSALLRSLRPAQWVKNLFVLVPLVFAHRLDRLDLALRSLAAFAAFCAAASAIYLLNDLRDREADRLHPVKRLRPIAAGRLGTAWATAASAVLASGAMALAWTLGRGFSICLGIYLALNVLYSLGLKRLVILDVMTISLGFVLRVEAGALAIAVEVSSWLLLCTIFVALFLGFAKRRHELALQAASAGETRAVLEHYSLTFVDQMINVVTASTVVSYALYTVDPATAARIGTPHLVVTVPLALFGIFRFLFLLYQKSELVSPTEAILRDPPFLVNMLLWGSTVLFLIYGL